MGEAFIVRRGGVVSDTTAAPTITIVTEAPDGVTFTLTNNDDNTAFITYEIDDEIAVIELAAAATSSNITVALALGTYTLTAYATVVGEVASQSTAAVEIVVIPAFELLYDSDVSATLPLTQIDITGLSIGKNDELRLVFTLTGDSVAYSFLPNDETTQTDYHQQRLNGDGTTISALRGNQNSDMVFTSPSSPDNLNKSVGFIDIKVSNNDRFVAQSQFIARAGAGAASIRNLNYNVVGSGFTLTSITKLTILANATNGIAAGSRIRLYKVNTGEA
jgi:hypothetical protein